jgi:hypothetical protein
VVAVSYGRNLQIELLIRRKFNSKVPRVIAIPQIGSDEVSLAHHCELFEEMKTD